MKRFGLIVLLSGCVSDVRENRDGSTEAGSDAGSVRIATGSVESATPTHRQVEPRRSILSNEQVGRLAIPFQENDGQWPDDVAFKADHFAGSLWVTNEGSIVYSLLGPQVDEAPEPESLQLGSSLTAPNAVTDPFGLHRAPSSLVEVVDRSSTAINFALEQDAHHPFERSHELPNRGPGWTLVEHFVHGHPHRPRGLDPAVTNVSYFIGNDESKWAPHVSTFGALTLGEVWPGIEVRLVARGNNVEKFFHVRPHRDPSLIEMSIEGSEPLRLSDDGALIVTTGNGEVELSPPVAFQVIDGERREVEVRYELVSGDSYRFILGDYDRSHEVVVDPILQSTYLGGSANEYTDGRVVLDAGGNVLVTGWSTSSNYPGVAGGAQTAYGGGSRQDIVVSRLNASLTTLLQSTYLGGSGEDMSFGPVALDGSANVVVVGFSDSSNYPGTLGGAQPGFGGGTSDIVVSRLNESLTSLLQSTYLGGTGQDFALGGPAVDGGVLVAGTTRSLNYPGTLGGAQAGFAGGSDIVVSRLNESLTLLVQSTYLGGSSDEATYGGTEIDGAGHVLVTGSSWSSNYPGTAGGAQSSSGGGYDIVISRLNSGLNSLLQSTYLGGSSTDTTSGGVTLDGSGNVLVAGVSSSTNYPGTLGGAQVVSGGGFDVVVSRVNSSLTSLLQSTYVGSLGADRTSGGVSVHSNGDVFVSMWSDSSDFPASAGGAQAVRSGTIATDIVICRLNNGLTSLLQSTYLGGSNDDGNRMGVTLDPDGNLLVGGYAGSPDYPGTSGGAQSTGFGQRIVVTRLTSDLLGCANDDQCLTSTALNVPNPSGGPIFSGRPVCNVTTRQCVQCLSNADCEDGNACTTNTCNVAMGTCSTVNLSAGTSCRASAGTCDIAETCPGGGAPCPLDVRRPNGFGCRPSTGTCDLAEVCDGVSPTCPADTNHAPNTIVCRAVGGLCDVAENCSGSSNTCPVDAFRNTSFECRAASGECDAAEFCAGNTAGCPVDVFDPSGTNCSGGVCNGTNMCVECVQNIDCEDGNPCTVNTCAGNTCSVMNAIAGTACGSGLSCNGSGSCSGCTMPSQCADGNNCTDDVCTAGNCTNPPLSEGASCATGVCEVNGAPSCVECVTDAQCSGLTPLCDVNANTCVACLLGSDCNDSNDCTNDVCTLGTCSHPLLTEGTMCGAGGLCSAGGLCQECLSDSDCSGSTPLCDPTSGICVPCTDPDVTCPSGVCITMGTNQGQCGGCDTSSDCSGPTPLCLPSSNTCVSCANPSATSMNVMCPANTMCEPATGACVPLQGCDDDSDCSSPTPTCDPTTRLCIGCGDGQVMCQNGDLCDPDTGRCGLDPNQDADDDGILNGIECPMLRDCPDTDGDGIADYLDSDDDGDSVPTSTECPNPSMCLDTDGDGTSNYLDTDDDGDGISTFDEVADGLVHGSDVDLDGVPNYLSTDSDRDGSTDRVEGRNNSPNGIPAYLDVNFLGGGGIAGGALRCSVDTQRRDTPIALFAFCTMALGFVRRRHLM